MAPLASATFVVSCAFLLLTLLGCFSLSVDGQFVQQPQSRNQYEITFNPKNNAAQAKDDYCGSSQTLYAPLSVMYTGTPANYFNIYFNTVPTNADQGNITLTLLSYTQNGTSFNANTNVTTPIWSKNPTRTIFSEYSSYLTPGTQQVKYSRMLSLDDSFICGGASPTSGDTHSATRCVLRWVLDLSSTTSNSRVACSDVQIVSRNDDARLNVQAVLDGSPILAQTAMNRLLQSEWAGSVISSNNIFTLPDDTDNSAYMSTIVRMPDTPIVISSDNTYYTISFIFSDTLKLSGSDVSTSLQTQDLSKMLNIQVQQATASGINDGMSASSPTSIWLMMMLLVVALIAY